MTSQEDYKKYFEVLELPSGATYSEVREAYSRLKDLYGEADSIVISPLEDELSEEWRDTVLDHIEEAYRKISEFYRSGGQAASAIRRMPEHKKATNAESAEGPEILVEPEGPGEDIRIKLDTVEEFSGEGLRKVRLLLGKEIHEVSLATKIAKQHLINIENDNFPVLPEEVFLRGYLRTCAKAYHLDPEKVVSDYLEHYRAWRESR